MSEDELFDLIFKDPELVFQLYEQNGGDYSDLKEHRFFEKFVQEKHPEISGNKDGAEFMFWLSYAIERDVTESITEIEIALGRKSREEAEKFTDKLGFGEKINFLVDKKYVEDKDDPYIEFLWKIKELRNHAAHGRLHKMEYQGYPLSHPKGQILITVDWKRALDRKHPLKP